MSSQQPGRSSGYGFSDQFESARRRVMDSEAVRTVQERIQTEGPELLERVKALASEAGVRRISIQHDGRTLFEFPLALGAVGALIAPQLAAIGVVAALLTSCTIAVDRDAPGKGASKNETRKPSMADSPEKQPTTTANPATRM